MRIAISYREDIHNGQIVESYARCFRKEFMSLGHQVFNVYYTKEWQTKDYDLYLELDNGRDKENNLGFNQSKLQIKSIPTAVLFTDSHGQPDLHQSIAKNYQHVFFAVWAKRDLFANHSSAHWCPNATDPLWFPAANDIRNQPPEFSFGFFGSKGGLDRTTSLKAICEHHGWSYDIRQVNGNWKPKWPFTAEAMANCANLFNMGQKHDGPNLRVLESMAVGRPLITEVDPKNGMDQLFKEGEHYLGYEAYTFNGLEEKMLWAIAHPGWALSMANKAYALVMEKHLIKHRAQQMMEVFNGTP